MILVYRLHAEVRFIFFSYAGGLAEDISVDGYPGLKRIKEQIQGFS